MGIDHRSITSTVFPLVLATNPVDSGTFPAPFEKIFEKMPQNRKFPLGNC